MTSAKLPDRRESDRRQGGRRWTELAAGTPDSVTDLAGWISFFRQLTYVRYLAVSVAALGIDLGVFLLLLGAGMAAMLASASGYSLGIVAHWLLSSRKVFHDRVSGRRTAARSQQKAMFVVSALIGLAVTTAIVGLGEAIGIDARLAKIIAVGVSFQLTYLLRNILIFRAG